MKTYINLTPHAINVSGKTFQPDPLLPPARVTTTRVLKSTIDPDLAYYVPTDGPVENLPEPQPGTIYIVSAKVRTHPDVSNRDDVASPGPLLRDQLGNVIGCDGLDFNL